MSEIPVGWAAPGAGQESSGPASGRRRLEKDGWRPGTDGIRSKFGVRASLRLVSTTGNALRERVQQVLVDEWRGIGIEATIHNVPSSTLTAGWQAGGIRKIGDFDALLANVGLGIGSVDPQSYLAQRHRCSAIPSATNNGAGANYERFCDGRVDQLLDDAGATLHMARRAAGYATLVTILTAKANS